MDYYYDKFSKLQEDFHEVMHDYPLFLEMIQEIEDRDIKEINELLEKNDEYYLKKAISKLEDLIKKIKETSQTIDKEYENFDKLARIWEKIDLKNISEKELSDINTQVMKANELIKSHEISDIKEANVIMNNLIKLAK